MNETQLMYEQMRCKIQTLEKENVELTERLLKVENAYKKKFNDEWRLNELYGKLQTDFANAEKCSREYFTRYRVMLDYFVKAKEHIKKLLDCLKQDTNDPQTNYYVVQCMTEAEQFLKDKNHD